VNTADGNRSELDSLIQMAMRRPTADDLEDFRRLARAVGRRLAGAPETAPPRDGASPAERYELSEPLGEGGMGRVVAGHDTKLGRPIAVKLLRDEHRDRPGIVSRFVEEAQIGGQLEHPGVVPVHDFGYGEEGLPYFTMKRVRGDTLASLLDARPDPDHDRARFLSVFEKIADTVAYAHARGIVHRDLKPSNVMVGAFGEVLVMDWGLAKVLGAERADDVHPTAAVSPATDRGRDEAIRSLTGSVMGTPGYMPPEQARGEVDAIDKRADVFSLGAILCQILTGDAPYTGTSRATVLERARNAALDHVGRRLDAAGADPALVALTLDCLAIEPDARPADAGIVAERVTAYRRSVEERLESARVTAARARARLIATVALLAGVVIAAGSWLWTAEARQKRERALAASVATGLADARAAVVRAEHLQAADVADASGWIGAGAQAEQVLSLARNGDVADALRARVERFHAHVTDAATCARERAARAVKDRRMAADLERLRCLPGAIFRWERQAEGYERAFVDYGIDPRALGQEEAVRRIRESAITDLLVDGLDDWAHAAWDARLPRALLRELIPRLLETAHAADDDPLRRRLRDCVLTADPATRQEKVTRLAETLELERTPVRMLVRLHCYLLQAGKKDAAAELLRRAAESRPGDFRLHFNLADLLEKRGEEADALHHFEIARALRPASGFPWVRGAHLQLRLGRHDRARRMLERSEGLPTDSFGSIHYYRGLVWSRLGDKKRAAKALRAAVEADPEYRFWRYALAEVLENLGELEEAARQLRYGVDYDRLRPTQLRTALLLGRVEYRRHRWLAARDVLERLWHWQGRTRDPSGTIKTRRAPAAWRGQAALLLGSIALRIGELPAAEQWFDRARPEAAPSPAWLGRARARLERHDFAAAEDCARRVILADPKNAEAHRTLASALRGLGRYADALRAEAVAVSRGAASRPDFVRDCRSRLRIVPLVDRFVAGERPMPTPRHHFAVARVLRDMGRFASACTVWLSVFRGHDDCAEAWPDEVLAAAGAAAHAGDAWFQQAIDWLRCWLDAQRSATSRPDPATALRTLRVLVVSERLRPLLDPAKIAKRPPEPRHACRKLVHRFAEEIRRLETRVAKRP